MTILNFEQFINEKFIPLPTDPVTTKSDKNWFNEEEILINKFNAFKAEIARIYNTYQNDLELMTRLFNKGFIQEKTKIPKKMRFKNKYLGVWANICYNNRKITDLEKIITDNEKDLQNTEQSNTVNKDNDTIQNYNQDKLNTTNDRLVNNREKVEMLQKEVLVLDKKLKKEFLLFKKKHLEVKKKLQLEDQLRKSAAADSNLDKNQGAKSTGADGTDSTGVKK